MGHSDVVGHDVTVAKKQTAATTTTTTTLTHSLTTR